METAGITAEELDHVVFYDKPWLKFERLLETYLNFAPRGVRSFLSSMPLWLKEKLWMGNRIKEELGFEGSVLFPEHHQSHAASAFYPSPFEEAAILTMDGVGEWASASIGMGSGHRIEITSELHFPHSLRLLYSAFTYYTGFKVNSGEYKVQSDGPGSLWRAQVCGSDLESPGGSQGRWLLPHGPALFQLLPGPDHDVEGVRRTHGRPSTPAGVGNPATGHGPGSVDSRCHRGDHASHGPPRPP